MLYFHLCGIDILFCNIQVIAQHFLFRMCTSVPQQLHSLLHYMSLSFPCHEHIQAAQILSSHNNSQNTWLFNIINVKP